MDPGSADRVGGWARARHLAGEPLRARTSAHDRGELVVTAKDAKTGQLIEGLCVFVELMERKFVCDKGTSVRVTRLPTQVPLVVGVVANPERFYMSGGSIVTLDGEKPTAHEQTLALGGRVSTKVVSRATGKGVGSVEVELRGADHPYSGGATVDPNGKLVTSAMPPGRYRLWVSPDPRTSLGAQWVGDKGGTGREHLATVVTVEEGKMTVAPKVRLDEGGALEGTFLNPDGTPAADVLLSTQQLRYFDFMVSGWNTDSVGDYHLPNLGPYDWSLRAHPFDGAVTEQWAGGEVRGDRAHTVRVVPGKTTEWNVRLARGTALSGAVNATGELERGIGFYDATTGESAGSLMHGAADTTYQTHVLGGGRYKAWQVTIVDDVTAVDGWHDSAATFETATPVSVPHSDAATADLRFTVRGR
ncbi:MAG TPA: hypothetical protein VFY17_04080 [Pilimelia sp.]|nr:hypothetical protein [Pilimelia sp.]